MTPCGTGKFCGSCQKTVIDFIGYLDKIMELPSLARIVILTTWILTSLCLSSKASEKNQLINLPAIQHVNSGEDSIILEGTLQNSSGSLLAHVEVVIYNSGIRIDGFETDKTGRFRAVIRMNTISMDSVEIVYGYPRELKQWTKFRLSDDQNIYSLKLKLETSTYLNEQEPIIICPVRDLAGDSESEIISSFGCTVIPASRLEKMPR